MYAYSTEGIGVQMQHLTSVLKIGVTGSAKIVLAQISNVNRAPIAGAFEFDFEKGEIVKAAAGAKEVIEYSFGEGVQLSGEPTYIHAAVPAGEYDELYVTLYDAEGGVMYATVKADESKPITAGKIREFSNNIAYAATESVFVVRDVASLKAFAEAAATLEKDVLFVADVDMTGEEWTPIEGYAMTVRGNGYAIKGLTAPLFGTTNASFNGLHLRDVNINETALPIVGALARSISATDTVAPTVEHCSASGKITVNCTEYEPLENSHITINVAGLVGYGLGTSFYDCKNGIEIEALQTAKTGNTTSSVACFGGICAFTYTYKRTDSSIVMVNFANCENSANISVTEKSYTGDITVEDGGTFSPLSVWVGGISGSDYSSSGQTNIDAVATNLVNRGDITVSTYASDCFVAGVIGNSYATTRENWVNYGNVTVKDSYNSRTFLAGVTGCIQSATLTKGINRGEIKAESSKSRETQIAGVLALDKATVTECTNYGKLNINIESVQRTATYAASKEYAIGGVVGSSSSSKAITDCYNYGELNLSSTLANCNKEVGYCGIGGVVGVLSSPLRGCHNEGTINVSANVTGIAVEDPANGNSEFADFAIGGLVGVNRVNSNNGIAASNKGSINLIEGTFEGPVYVGGLVGYAYERLNGNGTLGHTTNDGAITICKVGKTATFKNALHVAGCTAYFRTNHATDSDNNGAITLNAGVTTTLRSYVGGVFGFVKAISTRSINNGPLTIAGTFNDGVVVGGVTAYVVTNYLSQSENHGNITIKKGFVNNGTSGTSNTCIGGIIGIFDGRISDGTKKFALQASTNTGDITIEEGVVSNYSFYISGVAGYSIGSSATNLVNNGDIVINGTFNDRFGVAGCIAYNQTQVKTGTTGLTNNGNITLTTKTDCNTDAYIGGVSSIATEGNPLRYATNNGDISVSGEYDFNGRLCIAGVLGWDQIAGTNTLINTGDITINKDFKCTQGTNVKEIGGCIGMAQSTVTKAYNSGNITIKEGAQIQNGHFIGGCVADSRSAVNTAHNTGNIIIETIAQEGNTNTAGGALGRVYSNKTLQDIISYSDMQVTGYANFGFLVGSHRTETLKLTNGGIGGTYLEYDIEDGEVKRVPITEDNYKSFIYGSREETVWPDEATSDGVVLLTEKPIVPPVAE